MADDPDRKIRQTFRIGEFAAVALPPLPLRPPLRLTPGEREILALVVQGKTDTQIARARGITVRSLLNRLSSIFRKLGLKTREELVALVTSARASR